MNYLNSILRFFFFPVFIVVLLFAWVVIFFQRKRIKRTQTKPRLIWGSNPQLANQHWSDSMKEVGYASQTLMKWVRNFQNKNSYDLLYEDIKIFNIKIIDKKLRFWYASYIVFTYALRNADIFHHHFYGGFLSDTLLKRCEAQILKFMGCKVVITAMGGGDFYRYDSIINKSWLTGFLMCSPETAYQHKKKKASVAYWVKHADSIIVGYQIDEIGRWDIMPFNMITIPTKKITPKAIYSNANGKNDVVKIFHAPNHRGLKGTEFIIKAVDDLKSEGLRIELRLIEGLQNNELIKLMLEEADILVEQLLLSYGLNGIEGMAIGVAVVSNLENEEYTRIFRRYSYLNECPILSATPESIKYILHTLVTNPSLRKELGIANRKYAEKYHSEKTAGFIFESIYNKIWYQMNDVDLMQAFHPLNPSSYNNKSELINHPLHENKLRKVPANFVA